MPSIPWPPGDARLLSLYHAVPSTPRPPSDARLPPYHAPPTPPLASVHRRHRRPCWYRIQTRAAVMDFSFKDGKRLCSLLRHQDVLVDKKQRWLESMIPKPDGSSRRVKRPKFLADAYLAESDIRSEEVSCEKVRASVAKSFSSQCDGYNHHLVLDGLRLFNLQRGENGSLCPESLDIMHRTINKLSNEALQSVATIISHPKYTSGKTRPILRKIITEHLPSYLAKLDNEDTVMSQLSKILRNPCSYQSDCLNLVTPVSPVLLSSINQALDGLDGIPEQALVAVNRRLRGKSCSPKFWHVPRCSNRWDLIEVVRKRCKQIISQLPTDEGHYLPKKLAKAMSMINLYRKQKLRCMYISQLEFFPFSKETISLQNDVMNALWSLPKIKHYELKLLHPLFCQGSNVQKMQFKIALRRYLIECLFECDEGDLPDEALRAIAFINRFSRCQNVVLKEERKDAEVEAVLNVSSHLRALAYYDTEECSGDDGLISLGSDNCSEDNDFILSETSYLQFNSEQQMDVPCCSNNTHKSADMNECSSETATATHDVPKAGDSDSKSAEVFRKPCKRTEDSGITLRYRADETLENTGDANHLKTSMPSKILSEICDETSTVAYMLIGQILDKLLLMENVEVDDLTRHYLGGGLVSQGPQDARGLPNGPEENQKGDILVHAVEHILPTLPKSCIDRVKRLLS